MSSLDNSTIHLTIDGTLVEAEKGMTILSAAQNNGIYIPTLCAHKDLTPFGACRVCLVEVKGRNNYPSACTTPAEDGMEVLTASDKVQQIRKDIVQLIMGEHPSSCLICGLQDCIELNSTIRKVGVTTGCRTCPKDGQCELQKVVDYLDAHEVKYPIHYRMLPVERFDPFYDRDYNLCILCGRCVQVCQDIRLAGVLAFKKRGHETVIGPAFERSHLEAGCEFCGACVDVCPSGALSEKAKKWYGKPDSEVQTTCALCGIGCQLNLLTQHNEVIGASPAEGGVNKGLLCVKGRFAIPEMVNHHSRIKKPYQMVSGYQDEMDWDSALEKAAQALISCDPENFQMVVSPDCTLEDLYVAQKFVRLAMKSNHIASSANWELGQYYNHYASLWKRVGLLSDLNSSDAIVSLGLDIRYARSVVGVEVRKAKHRGAKVITLHPENHSLERIADVSQHIGIVEVEEVLQSLIKIINNSDSDDGWMEQVALMLRESKQPVFLIGQEYLEGHHARTIISLIVSLAEIVDARILPLPPYANLTGTWLAGAEPSLLPGGFSIDDAKARIFFEKIWKRSLPKQRENSHDVDILYTMGVNPVNISARAKRIIYQNIFSPLSNEHIMLAMPATPFSEMSGTVLNQEGLILKMNQAVPALEESRPNWWVISRLAQHMGMDGFEYDNAAHIMDEVITIWEQLAVNPVVAIQNVTIEPFDIDRGLSFTEHSYYGFPLAKTVGGWNDLYPVKEIKD